MKRIDLERVRNRLDRFESLIEGCCSLRMRSGWWWVGKESLVFGR